MARKRPRGHEPPGPSPGANHARPPGRHPRGGPTGTAEPAVGGLHVQPGGRAHRGLRPQAPTGARGCTPRGVLRSHDRRGAGRGRTPRPPAPNRPEGQRQGSEAGGVAGTGAPRRPRALARGPDHSIPLATGLRRHAIEGQAWAQNLRRALARVAAGRREAQCRPESRTGARDRSP